MTHLPLRADLAGHSAYGAPEARVRARLNVNENPYQPSEAIASDIAAAVKQAAKGANRYPQREFPQLRAALATYLQIEAGVEFAPEEIWAANGSNEVMLQLLQAFAGAGASVISCPPTYSMYPEYAHITQTRYLEVPRDAHYRVQVDAVVAAAKASGAALVLLASPNNPTGTATHFDVIAELAHQLQGAGPAGADTLLIVDEAYGEFRRKETKSALALVHEYRNLAVSRTMSKAFAMAGLRLGYLAARGEIIDALRLVRLPYHLSAITQGAAVAALGHSKELLSQVDKLSQRRDETVTYLRAEGFDAIDSDANFVLFGPFRDRHRAFQQLFDRGVLIREVGPAGYLRVSIGTSQEMEMFRNALKEVDR